MQQLFGEGGSQISSNDNEYMDFDPELKEVLQSQLADILNNVDVKGSKFMELSSIGNTDVALVVINGNKKGTELESDIKQLILLVTPR